MNNIVLNIPHSSINGIFEAEFGAWPCNPHFVNDCVNRWTDWNTPLLFMGLSKFENVQTVIFPYSRFVCDAERLPNDEKESVGQGIIYTEFDGYQRSEIDAAKKNKLVQIWNEHQNTLKKYIVNEHTLLIDCHSFPSDLYNCDICIGYNDDWSFDKRIVDGIIKIFKDRGYSVAENKPYSNSLAPNMPFNYKSIMIEVNKRIYMNETTLQLNKETLKWIRWDGTLKEIHQYVSNLTL